ncbi:RloB family protein [Fibrobacter sp.]|uniref:RloB family protein n=1 Tax=Fibrobacter sp. TaxID=35828 RepID=UPI00388E7A02
MSIEGKGKATKALVNKVIRQIDNCNQEYDRVWAVFDKDEFDDFDDAIKLAESKNINCAWSNKCFELWLLLHFKDVSVPTGRKVLFEELEQAIRNALHKNAPEALFDLSKGNDKIYELVTSLGSEAEAIRRASALKAMFKGTAKPSEQNPCTQMDLLIHELRHPETIPLSSDTRKENLT